MTLLADLQAFADPDRAGAMANYHKAARPYLGVSNPRINEFTKLARHNLPLQARVGEAGALWASNIHEARILAAKLFDQPGIHDDAPVWALICRWVRDFDAWAIADHVCKAGAFRLLADPSRLDHAETWSRDRSIWVRRAALVMTLPWARLKRPGPDDIARRERILGWAASYVGDREWFIQKSVAWWLRELSAHDPDRAMRFVRQFGAEMQAFARKEALRNL